MKQRRTLIAYILTFVIVLGSFSTVYSDETKVYSGHGAASSIGRERVSNPFLR